MSEPANPHLTRPPVAAGRPVSGAQQACVLVHGRDQDETVMLDVVERLGLDEVAYLLPVASGCSWYSGRYFDPPQANEPQVSWAIEACEAAIAVAREAGIRDESIIVGGFSQGACIVAELLARQPRSLAGAAILTGSLLGRPGTRIAPAHQTGLRMFFGLSRYDEWIALEDAQATADAFVQAGARVTFETYEDRVHHVSDRAVAGLRTLLVAS